MKQIKTAATILLLLSLVFSCSKDNNDSNNPPSGITAQPANDNKSGGVYKGTITGSSGSFYINLQDGDNKIYTVFDGQKDTLSTTTVITSGAAISQALFTGHTGMSLVFSVSADGNNPVVNSFTIPGHPFAEAFMFKEKSNQQVMVFEGRFTKTAGPANCESGMINALLIGNTLYGYFKEDGGQHLSGHFTSTVSNNQFSFTAVSATGNCTINSSKSQITGTASDPSGCASTVSCTRTL
ncbi:MAG: hypothetical protein ABIT05_06215 [Chitinophagaceae bacterium]